MDAPHQVAKAKKHYTSAAKKNRRQQDMKLKEMVVMEGKFRGHDTKVNVGKTKNGTHKVYSVTIKRRKG